MANGMLKQNENYFPALTGIRAVAAMMVFFHHFNPFAASTTHVLLKRFITEWHTGVSVFFVLSGFLICYRYYDDCTFSGEWMKRYLKNRIARIYPIYLLLTVCTFIVFAYQGSDDNSLFIFISNLFFFRGFSDALKFSGIAQGWSLTVEETFYFSAPLLFLLAKKYKLLFVQPVLWLLSGGLLVLLIGQLGKFPFMENYPFMLGYTFFGRSTEFFAGIALALYLKKRMPHSTSSAKNPLQPILEYRASC